jgi:uncharacterized membrane protein YccF (DUF307 family)
MAYRTALNVLTRFAYYLAAMNGIANIIWLLFGGLWAALGYVVGGFILCCTIIGIPFGLQCFKIAGVVLWPFGKRIVDDNNGLGCLSLLANIVWLVCGGIWVALAHLVFGLILCITVIGIPFGVQHFKLIGLSMMPFGKRVE